VPRKEIGWIPILIGTVLLFVIAFAISVALRSSSPASSSTTSTTSTPGVKLWSKELTLKVAQQYGLDHPSATIDNTCSTCILVELVYHYGMALSDSGGLEIWPHGAPTFRDCARALASSLPAVPLYDPPSNTSKTAAKVGSYMCAYASNGTVLSLRYDGSTDNGNAFKFRVTNWSVG
jgi:hypothetical protein